MRVGAEGPFPAPYDYSVTFVCRGGYAEPVGFNRKSLPPSEFELIIRKINEATGLLVAYDRVGPPPSRVVQIALELTKGRIRMSHEHKHRSVNEAKDANGNIDQNIVVQHSLEAIQAILAGKLKITAMSESNISDTEKNFSFTAKIV